MEQTRSKETCTKKEVGGMEQIRSKETCTNMRKETRSQAARGHGGREVGDMQPGSKETWSEKEQGGMQANPGPVVLCDGVWGGFALVIKAAR